MKQINVGTILTDFFCFLHFRGLLRVHGSAYRLIFTKYHHSLAGQFCDQEIDSAFVYQRRSQSHLTS